MAAGYRTTCREQADLWELAAASDNHVPVLSPSIRKIAEGEDLHVDPRPRLVLFHRRQGAGKFNKAAWSKHREKLEAEGVEIIESDCAEDIRLAD